MEHSQLRLGLVLMLNLIIIILEINFVLIKDYWWALATLLILIIINVKTFL